MRVITCLFIASLTFLYGCNSNNTEHSTSPGNVVNATGHAKDSAVYDDPRQNLQLLFPDTVRVTRLFIFSDPDHFDTFRLIVPRGPVAKTKSCFMIKTADNRIIHSEYFETYFFVKSEIYDNDIAGKSPLVADSLQVIAHRNIDSFFKNFSVQRDFAQDYDDNEIINRDLYAAMIKDSSAKMLFFPCFDCDEGNEGFGYSIKEGKALEVLSYD